MRVIKRLFAPRIKWPFFQMTSHIFISLLFLSYFLPLGYFVYLKNFDFQLCLVFAISALVGLFLLQLWEHKMQKAIAKRVKGKLKEAHLPEFEIKEKLKCTQEELHRVRSALNECIRSYEHQLDLLQSSAAKSREKTQEVVFHMERKNQEAHAAQLRYDDLRKEFARLHNEYLELKNEALEKQGRHASLMGEYQQTIAEQRQVLEKKQRSIEKLEARVEELGREIKELLKLESNETHQESGAPFDLSHLLNRYIEMAENLTGVDHLGYLSGSAPRFLDTTHGSFHLDLRRLFELYRDETAGIVFVFSRIEKKFLFVNSLVRILLGWSEEKFSKDFFYLLVSGKQRWEKEVEVLRIGIQKSFKLSLKKRSSAVTEVNCHLAMIGQGPFAGHIIGLLLPVQGPLRK